MAQSTPPPLSERPALLRALAFLVHVLTASGAAFALLALIDAINLRWPQMFGWLAVALAVDAVDGTLARRLGAAEILPRYSGDILDLVVDYLGYVLVPALAIVTGDILPPSLALLAGAAILISSAIYFADRRMKTESWYFRGFPAAWNLIAFYLFLLRPDPYVALAAVALFVLMTFLPVYFIHPLRVTRLRRVNVALTAVWSALAIYALWCNLAPPAAVTAALTAIGVYFLFAGLLHPRERTKP
jgi:phosphatidylcholine synthase